MNLEQIAQQAMDHLDSVGVTADWELGAGAYKKYGLIITAGDTKMAFMKDMDEESILYLLKNKFPQKSPD